MSTRTSTTSFRVVTYNVLSSHLASPLHYTTLDPEHLNASNRFQKILTKLEQEIIPDQQPTVFCLQEVSYEFAGKLHTFFAARGFHVVTGLYGKKFNGYMGVVTAWPTKQLEAVSVDISRVSDTVTTWPRAPDESVLRKLYKSLVQPPLKLIGLLNNDEQENHWSMAERRFNVMLTTVLQDKESKQQFCIGNYHMPCAFYAPMVMTMHADMCLAHVQKLAQSRPYVLTGDFNIKPTESVYKYLTTGELVQSDPFYPTPFLDCYWKPTIQEPVRSAYAIFHGKEPDFTNYARVKEDEPFIDTLDYIFVSKKIRVKDVPSLVDRNVAAGPFPNAAEPSDHVLVAANLEILADEV